MNKKDIGRLEKLLASHRLRLQRDLEALNSQNFASTTPKVPAERPSNAEPHHESRSAQLATSGRFKNGLNLLDRSLSEENSRHDAKFAKLQQMIAQENDHYNDRVARLKVRGEEETKRHKTEIDRIEIEEAESKERHNAEINRLSGEISSLHEDHQVRVRGFEELKTTLKSYEQRDTDFKKKVWNETQEKLMENLRSSSFKENQ